MATILPPAELARRRDVQKKLLRTGSIISRAEWKAHPPVGMLDYDWNYDSIVVHYTGHHRYPSMQAIQAFDMGHDRHWQDVAYHYAIDGNGRIFEGREILFKGSDVFRQNTGKIGIVCMGDFDRSLENLLLMDRYSGEVVPPAMLRSLETLSILLRQSFPIRVFGGHIEFGRTAVCPGSNLLPLVQALRAKLKFQAPTFQEFQ